MPLNDPAAYTPSAMPPELAGQNAAPPQPGGMDHNVSQCLAGRMQTLSPEDKAILASLVTPQTAPSLMKLMPELQAIMPRVSTMLPGQHNTQPAPQQSQGSPLASTPIAG